MGLIGSKPLASLSSGLLARKGQAKPAMRPQSFNRGASLDDLGWNDMGQASAPVPLPVPEAPLPPVLVEREALEAEVAPPAAVAETPVEAAVVDRIGRESAAQTAGGKAAFTLRLDAPRHLRLRLASAVANRSAQALVADALDRFLATMPDVEALAAQLPAKGSAS